MCMCMCMCYGYVHVHVHVHEQVSVHVFGTLAGGWLCLCTLRVCVCVVSFFMVGIRPDREDLFHGSAAAVS